MGFWASADQSVPSGVSPDASKLVKYRTPNFEGTRGDIMAAYAARSRATAPANVVAAKAGYTAPSGAGAAMQQTAATSLGAAAAGKGPSAAGAVMGQGTDDALRARMSAMAGRGLGANSTLASSQAGGVAASALQQAAAQSAAVKAREVQDASGQYGQLAGAMRAGDFATMQGANTVGLANAGMEQSVALANQKARMQWEQMSDAERNALLGMSMGLDQQEMQNRLNYYRLTSGMAINQAQGSYYDRARQDSAYGQLVAGGGTAAAAMAQSMYGDEDGDDLVKGLRRK